MVSTVHNMSRACELPLVENNCSGRYGGAVHPAEKLTEREAVISITPLGSILQELRRVVELHLGGATHVIDRQDRIVRLSDTEVDDTLWNDHLLELNRRHTSNVGRWALPL